MEKLPVTDRPIRVALFPDSLHEVNGVANTCRNFVAYAQRHELPLLLVCAAAETATVQDGSVTRLGLRRGPVSFALEKDLRFDAAILRYRHQVIAALKAFQPDVIHITGPNDIGMLGAFVAHELGISVAASWHTNVHEYAARRAERILPRLFAGKPRARTLQAIEDVSFHLSALFYRVGRFHYAPNLELIAKLQKATHKNCALMERGVDLDMFTPAHRDRQNDGEFVIGYAGRLSTEKKVRSFAALSLAVRAAGLERVKFVFVGHGQEEAWLRQHVPGAEFTGVLRGQALARAYANMDLFAFFSETDTFGNVVLEALASGVPAVVTDKGGPKFIVEHERCGFVCADDYEFQAAVLRLATDRALHSRFAVAARERAQRASWDAVFASVYDTYRRELPQPGEVSRPSRFRRTMSRLSRAHA